MGYRVSVRDEEKFWTLMVVIVAFSVNVLSAIGTVHFKGNKMKNFMYILPHTHTKSTFLSGT